MASLFLNCVKISYSMGASCEIMFEYYLEYLKYYKDVCSADDSMYDMIDILSLGVLFKNKRDMFVSDLRETVSKFESSDGMLECFMNYIDDIPFQKKLSRIEYFNQLVSGDNKEKVLLNQLEVWYQEHTEAYWYNAHNAKNNTYCGYWCFEVAALSRVFNVDDCQLKKSPYYPYDLAHYTINQ